MTAPNASSYFMAYDVLRQILERAADLPELSSYVTSMYRDLTGARCACLLVPGSGPTLDVLSVSPERARGVFTAEVRAGARG